MAEPNPMQCRSEAEHNRERERENVYVHEWITDASVRNCWAQTSHMASSTFDEADDDESVWTRLHVRMKRQRRQRQVLTK